MKRLSFVALLIAATVFVACKSEREFSVNWDLSRGIEAGMEIDSVVLSVDGNSMASTTQLKDGHAILHGETDKAEVATLTLYFTYHGEHNEVNLDVIVEPGLIMVNNETNSAEGTELNDAVTALFKQLDEAEEAGEDCTQPVIDFVAQHKEDASVIPVLCDRNVQALIGHNEVERLLEEVSPEIMEHSNMQALQQKLESTRGSRPGKMFIDFEAEYDGNVQHFSDYVGKGKYIIADFWASWCGPCRREIPGLIEVYNKYKGDDFEVIGVATWDKPEDTQKAIEELGIPYPQIMNAQRAGSDAYHIEGIPEIILFAPDGTILKRGLRGNEIGKAVSEALGR